MPAKGWRKEKQICSIDDCNRVYWGRDFCSKHYWRWYRYGDPLFISRREPNQAWNVFWDAYNSGQLKESECWIWSGCTDGKGYGVCKLNGKQTSSHIAVYKTLVGEIPEGLELDHLCRITMCCNPNHLETVTHRTNLLRGDTVSAKHAAKTKCPRGHEYTGRDVRGSRTCNVCARNREREKRNGKKY